MSFAILKTVSALGLIGTGTYFSFFFNKAPSQPKPVASEQIKGFESSKGFEQCLAFLTDNNKTSVLLYCIPKVTEGNQTSKFFYFSSNKNGELKTISKSDKPNIFKVTFDSDSKQETMSVSSQNLNDIGKIDVSECQINSKGFNGQSKDQKVSCYKNDKWSRWDEPRITWELKEFQ